MLKHDQGCCVEALKLLTSNVVKMVRPENSSLKTNFHQSSLHSQKTYGDQLTQPLDVL